MITKIQIYIFFLLIVFGNLYCSDAVNKDESNSNTIIVSADKSADLTSVSKNIIKIDKNKLNGKWERTDGTYQIEIKDINENGKLDAAYFNPNPIHVETAEWKLIENKLLIMIKLQDINYPGSTYTLEYLLTDDRLSGNYYQAVDGLYYDVTFARKN